MRKIDSLPPGIYLLSLLILLGCSLTEIAITPTLQPPTLPAIDSREPIGNPTQTSESTPMAAPTEEILPDTGWVKLHPGLERRNINILTAEGGIREQIYLIRIDPAFYHFDIAYDPGKPKSLTDWQRETGALVVVNGGFFTESNEATGLIIANGQSSGVSYVGFGGMLAIDQSGPKLRWLLADPYSPDERLLAGIQSFPMLVKPGGQLGFPEEDGLPARRTVISQDSEGRMIFLLASTGTFTLHELSRYLVESDLNLELALNLDGGASTGLLLSDPVDGVAPFTLLPSVIIILAK